MSVFKKNSKIGRITRYGKAGSDVHGKKPGSVLTVEFTLNGEPFMALNGGPEFKFTEAVSFQVPCKSQAEIDYYWEKLGKGGDPKAQICGWLKDKYGLSWQIFPAFFYKLKLEKDGRLPDGYMNAMMKMRKLDFKALKAAANG